MSSTWRKPKALGQAQRGVEALDVDAERLARRLRFGLQLPQQRTLLAQRRADPAIAGVGQQRDVDDADLLRPAGDVETPDRLPVRHDHVEARVRVVLALDVLTAPNGEL